MSRAPDKVDSTYEELRARLRVVREAVEGLDQELATLNKEKRRLEEGIRAIEPIAKSKR